MNEVQITAFAKGKTPYPRWCLVFTMLTGLYHGEFSINHPNDYVRRVENVLSGHQG